MLVGGFKHVYFPFHIWDVIRNPLTFTPSFFKMVKLHHQPGKVGIFPKVNGDGSKFWTPVTSQAAKFTNATLGGIAIRVNEVVSSDVGFGVLKLSKH